MLHTSVFSIGEDGKKYWPDDLLQRLHVVRNRIDRVLEPKNLELIRRREEVSKEIDELEKFASDIETEISERNEGLDNVRGAVGEVYSVLTSLRARLGLEGKPEPEVPPELEPEPPNEE